MPAKGKAKVVPKDETPEDAFRRLAKARTTKAVLAIRQLGKLSGGRYVHTPEQVSVLVNLIQSELDATKAAFAAPKAAGGTELQIDI